MDIRQLEYFVCVAELGSFTRASIALNVAQPVLSRQIRQLEVEVGQNLLVRNGRGAFCSEAGKLLLGHARGILHQMERTRGELERLRGIRTDRIAVGLPPTLARSLSLPLVKSFQTLMPDATLSITEGLSSQIQESLVKARVDIALLYHTQPTPDIETIPLHKEALFLVERCDAPGSGENVTLEALAQIPLVMPGRYNAFRILVEEALNTRRLKPLMAVDVDGVGTILELVISGIGAAILPKNAIANFAHADRLRLRGIAQQGLFAQLSLATSTRRPGTLLQQETIRLIKELLSR
ncbi:LysR substrate-binding domain-containing protein [Winslowiella sp. 2C04]|uniref:LysR substrate-binding domain-containing protein n=1 Tax=Winslowiella sp. 2C04 TaxID=3416179 RepID=UPI003CEA79D2